MRSQTLLLTIIGVLFCFASLVSAQRKMQQETRPERDRSILVHVEPDKRLLKWLLDSNLDIMCVHHQHLDILANPLDIARLKAMGIPVNVINENVYGQARAASGFLDEYLTLAEVETQLNELATNYPNLTELTVIGTSIEGRDIHALKISDNAASDEDEAEILIMGNHHARELITPIICMHVANELLGGYGSNTEFTEWVNEREIWIVPVVNPDGYFYVETEDLFWRKNRRDNPGLAEGVDLNRNWGFEWGHDNLGSSISFGSQTYRGTGPASEPEIAALQKFVATRDFKMALSYHSFGNLLLWGTGYKPIDSKDQDIFQGFGDIVSAQNNYTVGNQADGTIYFANGECTDYLYNVEGIIAFTPEVGTSNDFFNPTADRIPVLVEEGSVCAWEILRFGDRPGQVAPPGQPLPNKIASNAGNFDVTWGAPVTADTEVVVYELTEKTGGVVITDDVEDSGSNFNLDSWASSSVNSFSGDFSLFSGSANTLDRVCLSKEGYVVQPGDTYSFRALWNLENDFDYAYAVISTDGGRSYEALPGSFTTMNDPNARNADHGITGQSNGWQLLEFDLSSFVGQTVWFGFRINTDGFTVGDGMWIDGIHPVQTWSDSTVIDANITENSYSFNDKPAGTYHYSIRGLDAENEWGYPSANVQSIVTETFITLASYEISRGNLVGGELVDATFSDDSYLRINPGFTLNSDEPPVWLIFDGTSANSNSSSLSLEFETSVSTPNILQTIEAFNWSNGLFEIVDMASASFNTDTTRQIDLTASVGDFVNLNTGAVRCRAGYKVNGFLIQFPWTVNVDRVGWSQ